MHRPIGASHMAQLIDGAEYSSVLGTTDRRQISGYLLEGATKESCNAALPARDDYWILTSARRSPYPKRVLGAASLGRLLMEMMTYWALTGSGNGMVGSGEGKLLVPTCLAPPIAGRSFVKTLMLPPEAPSWLSVMELTFDDSFSFTIRGTSVTNPPQFSLANSMSDQ